MTPRHYKILDYCVAGIMPKEISKLVGMSKTYINIVINSPSFQHQLAIRRDKIEEVQAEHASAEIDEVKTVLQEAAISAANKLIGTLSSNDEKISLKGATEILDRTGYPKEQKLSGDVGNKTQIIINATDLNNLKESLDLSAQPAIIENEKSVGSDINEEKLEETGTITGS